MYILSFLSCILALCTTFPQAHAEEVSTPFETPEEMGVEDEKIYLDTDDLFFNDHQLFLRLDQNQYIEIPFLFSDESGCWTTAQSLHRPSITVNVLSKCRFCGHLYCIKCSNPDCSSNKKPASTP